MIRLSTAFRPVTYSACVRQESPFLFLSIQQTVVQSILLVAQASITIIIQYC